MTSSQPDQKIKVLSTSEDILIYFWQGNAYVLDVRQQSEYQITDRQYWNVIGDILFNSRSKNKELLNDLLTLGLIKQDQQFTQQTFFNWLAHIFHIATKDGLWASADLGELEYANAFDDVSRKTLKVPLPAR